MILATKTLEAIKNALLLDGGAKFREWQGKVLPHMHDAYRSDKEGPRGHLGASQIGKECGRALWYGFRQVGEDPREEDDSQARMIRLWNRGHLEEGRFIALLLMIGCRIVQHDSDKKQLRFKGHHGHFAGSMDGEIHGCPDLESGIIATIEFKTYNDKRFTELTKNGVKNSDETYYVQMQQYMAARGRKVALFCAVNKNTDELHMELVDFDQETAEGYHDRAGKIIFSEKVPLKLRGASMGFFKCKFCDFAKLCHMDRDVAMNCRTCAFSEPAKEADERGNGVWRCRLKKVALSKDDQTKGCGSYRRHEGL